MQDTQEASTENRGIVWCGKHTNLCIISVLSRELVFLEPTIWISVYSERVDIKNTDPTARLSGSDSDPVNQLVLATSSL